MLTQAFRANRNMSLSPKRVKSQFIQCVRKTTLWLCFLVNLALSAARWTAWDWATFVTTHKRERERERDWEREVYLFKWKRLAWNSKAGLSDLCDWGVKEKLSVLLLCHFIPVQYCNRQLSFSWGGWRGHVRRRNPSEEMERIWIKGGQRWRYMEINLMCNETCLQLMAVKVLHPSTVLFLYFTSCWCDTWSSIWFLFWCLLLVFIRFLASALWPASLSLTSSWVWSASHPSFLSPLWQTASHSSWNCHTKKHAVMIKVWWFCCSLMERQSPVWQSDIKLIASSPVGQMRSDDMRRSKQLEEICRSFFLTNINATSLKYMNLCLFFCAVSFLSLCLLCLVFLWLFSDSDLLFTSSSSHPWLVLLLLVALLFLCSLPAVLCSSPFSCPHISLPCLHPFFFFPLPGSALRELLLCFCIFAP